MTPSDQTIRTALALPLEVRRLLAEKAEGPGWYIQALPGGGGYLRQWAEFDRESPMQERDAMRCLTLPCAWLPASEGEILRVWAKRARALWTIDTDDAWLVSGPILDGTEHSSHAGTYDSRLRAALQCCPIAPAPTP